MNHISFIRLLHQHKKNTLFYYNVTSSAISIYQLKMSTKPIATCNIDKLISLDKDSNNFYTSGIFKMKDMILSSLTFLNIKYEMYVHILFYN